MSAARKLSIDTVRKSTLDNEFEASIDQAPPVSFRANFARVNYPQLGDCLTITATLRDPVSHQIKSIKVIFTEDPIDNTPRRNTGMRIYYGDTAEVPPSEYSTYAPMTALDYNSQTLSISGTIDAHLEDGLEVPKSHDVVMNFSLVAEQDFRRA
ncbi:hypothetical protein HNO91_08070 [Pseudomonas corrugata]|uniref:Uncharacterized protein n=1 Tax=Pseudomonas corrugata TaxID=47879 RepID=A0A7Y5Z3K5_9PSED|nr:hypothetical protein [Pseudomonas corrugata]NUT86373.1 hypothetical protein [Pseudomonas corrugata]